MLRAKKPARAACTSSADWAAAAAPSAATTTATQPASGVAVSASALPRLPESTDATTASELRQRTHALCRLVVEAAGAQPVHTGYVEALRASLAQAPAGQLGDALSRPLCDLAASLLSDLPFRLVREAVALLHAAALNAAAAAQSALLVHAARAGFFGRALQHANREVRHTSLELLGLLAPEVSGVPSIDGAVNEVVHGCALPRLCELIEMGQGRDGPAVAEVLRALCRNAAGAAACREAGLSARLRALSPRARQGAAGQAVSEVLLRMGFLGGTSELVNPSPNPNPNPNPRALTLTLTLEL